MKILKYTEENFEFKKAIKENIKENFNQLLKENRFKKFTPIVYMRDIDGVLQTITFKLTIYRLEVYCSNMPLFIPYIYKGIDKFYGADIIWICAKSPLLGQKIALEHYNNSSINELKVLKDDLKNFIIPGMDKINSFEKLALKIKNKKENELVFLKSFNYHKQFTNCGAYELEELIKIVYTSIYGDFEEGINNLKNFHLKLKDELRLNEDDILALDETINKLLFTNDNNIIKEQFLKNYELVCDESRIKYKLKK